MKQRLLPIIAVILSLLFLSSCADNDNTETYFIHAVSFSQKGQNQIEISAICEKSGDEKCFVISESGKTPDDAAEKLSKEYKDCYFATCKVYFFEKDTNTVFLKDIAHKICESNIFPTKSHVIIITGTSPEKLLNTVKSKQQLTDLIKSAKGKEKNVVHFLSAITLGKNIDAPTVDYSDYRKKGNK